MIKAEIIYIFYQVKQMINRNIKKKNSSREKQDYCQDLKRKRKIIIARNNREKGNEKINNN